MVTIALPGQMTIHYPEILADGRALAGATFSPCQTYRYRLWRYWNPAVAPVTWILLNPSTADALHNDPTIHRCQSWSYAWGAGGIEVVNLFALRATDPGAMRAHAAPIGPDNDAAIDESVALADQVLCAWGNHGSHHNRAREVLDRLAPRKPPLYHLGTNADGSPKHPLYLPSDRRPELWIAA